MEFPTVRALVAEVVDATVREPEQLHRQRSANPLVKMHMRGDLWRQPPEPLRLSGRRTFAGCSLPGGIVGDPERRLCSQTPELRGITGVRALSLRLTNLSIVIQEPIQP